MWEGESVQGGRKSKRWREREREGSGKEKVLENMEEEEDRKGIKNRRGGLAKRERREEVQAISFNLLKNKAEPER